MLDTLTGRDDLINFDDIFNSKCIDIHNLIKAKKTEICFSIMKLELVSQKYLLGLGLWQKKMNKPAAYKTILKKNIMAL